MTELWRPLPDYEGLYEVSSLGRIRSQHFTPPRLCALGTDSNGYRTVALSKDGKRTTKTVHRLVCRAFHGEPYLVWNEAAHLDGDRGNCRADNLKWASKVENHYHQRGHGTHMAGEKHPRAKLSAADVMEIRAKLQPRNAVSLAREYGVGPSIIKDIRNGRRWTHI